MTQTILKILAFTASLLKDKNCDNTHVYCNILCQKPDVSVTLTACVVFSPFQSWSQKQAKAPW